MEEEREEMETAGEMETEHVHLGSFSTIHDGQKLDQVCSRKLGWIP